MGEFQIVRLLIEHQKSPIGMDRKNPRLCWTLHSKKTDVFQDAYAIEVSAEAGEKVWKSGKINSSESTEVVLEELELIPMTRYKVHVTVWNNYGEEASAEGEFETGKMETPWETSWIEPEQIPTEDTAKEPATGSSPFDDPYKGKKRDYHEFRPVQYIRIPFTVNGNAKKGRIYITAHGIYRLYLNGNRIDMREFAPEITAYHKILMYQTYDVTEFLNNGENVIGIELAEGWWSGRVGMYGDSCQYGDTTGLLLEGRIILENGEEIIVSAEDGKSTTGPLIFSDLFVGEKYDATKEIDGWNTAGYDDSSWKPVIRKDYSTENIVAQYGEPVCEFRTFQPQEIFKSPREEWILDVGQVVAGNVEISLNTDAGIEISLEHSEVLDEQGNFYNNIIGKNKEQKDFYITKSGEQIYRPHFTYHGFRYVKVTGWPGEPQKENFKIVCFTSKMENLNSFQSSDPRLNQLMKNIWWSQVANTISIPTDCPQRERAGWGGDAMVFAPTMCKLRDADAFLTRWMASVRADQKEDGAVPKVIPYLKCYSERVKKTNSSDTCCGWGDVILQVPLTMYREYGDLNVLKENYEAMKKWLAYIEERAENHHPEEYEQWDKERKERSRYLWNTDFHYGDWLVPSMVLGNSDGRAMIKTAHATMKYVAPGYYANSAKTMAEIAGILGNKNDENYYIQLFEQIKKAFIAEYITPEGRMPVELQGVYVIALKNHLYTEPLRKKMAAHLIEMIEQNNGCLDTGFLSVHYLLDVLCENGYRDEAYKILFQTKCPSWMYEVEHGATTMWESWGAIGENGEVSTYSYNHYAFGCIGDWIIREIGGIQKRTPGYKEIYIKPSLDCGLKRSECSLVTPYGKVSVKWEILDGQAQITVEIPCNTKAFIKLPGEEKLTVASGKYQFNIAYISENKNFDSDNRRKI